MVNELTFFLCVVWIYSCYNFLERPLYCGHLVERVVKESASSLRQAVSEVIDVHYQTVTTGCKKMKL